MNAQQLGRLQDLNIELLDTNRNLMSYLIQVYKKNGITGSEITHADELLAQVSKVLQKIDHQPKIYREKINRRFDRTSPQVL